MIIRFTDDDSIVEAYRAELHEAKVEYTAKIAQAKAHFDKEAAAMRREFAETLAELKRNLDQLGFAIHSDVNMKS